MEKQIFKLILDTMHEVWPECKNSEIKPETRLKDIGMDSIIYMMLIFDLEEKLRLQFNDQMECNTFQDVIDHIRNLQIKKND